MSTERFVPGTVERFVQAVVAGGITMVAGLWLTALFRVGSLPWLAGVALAVAGVAGLAWGIYSELSL
ncbi:hypothetical protein ACOZ4N_07555 [Halorientalis pallida]|uniref:hypothetical protein n=1 Tax=Halorientalis pallida TaxID=2479928 RepID=UPI003C700AED